MCKCFFEKTTIALFGALYLLFSCTISTALIYFVKGRVYHDKIKVFYDTASKVASGDFNVRIPILFDKPKSEIDYLAVNFNKMLVEISSLENMRNDFVIFARFGPQRHIFLCRLPISGFTAGKCRHRQKL